MLTSLKNLNDAVGYNDGIEEFLLLGGGVWGVGWVENMSMCNVPCLRGHNRRNEYICRCSHDKFDSKETQKSK